MKKRDPKGGAETVADPLDTFATELRAQHAALTQAYEAEQQAAEAAWARFEAADAALTTFRAKYGRVLKALPEEA